MEAVREVVAFLLGGVATALLRAGGTRFMERARPSARAVSVRCGATEDAERTTISIDYALIVRERENPLLPKLATEMTAEALRSYAKATRGASQAHGLLTAHLQGLLNRTSLLQPGVSDAEQRKSILLEWSRFGSECEALALTAIKYNWAKVKDIYKQSDPSTWLDPQAALITLTPGKEYNLRQIDVEGELAREMAVQGPLGLEDKLRRHLQAMNALRRFWIHLDENDLRWLLARVLEVAATYATDAGALIDSLEQTIATHSPEYLLVDVLVANDGKRAFAVGSTAFLLLPISDEGEAQSYLADMVNESSSLDRAEPVVVEGQTARLLTFRSKVPLAALTLTSNAGRTLDGQRLRAIFHGATVECQLALAIAGFGLQTDHPVVSNTFAFGSPAEAVARRRLAESLGVEI